MAAAAGLADRIDRQLETGGGLIGTDRPEARALLAAINQRLTHDEPPRLVELRDNLRAFLGIGRLEQHFAK